ncbi:TetR/AcrR family transcriptional regulator (plasmid) [Embleya sp. NBC_00888]|uniref:TetR family transcriptional regulator n=1 Tax=Embleya sp. NBC_00888 TaxID=2975960 RepID=UPI002F916482|nr:TetR/AcrR family transcriptional regulator [Embleya sp. NBC_00888]
MSGEMGLRERKRLRMAANISDVAIGLFLARGFDAVSVAEIAEAAEVSKPTLFRYFPTKEDLVLHRFADHQDEAGRVVAGRPEDVSALTALRRHFLAGLDRHDPVTGLSDDPQVLAFHRLLYGTPALLARVFAYTEGAEDALAAALGGPDEVEARLAAGQIIAVQRILARENWRRIAAGERAADLRAVAGATAERAFDQLEVGLTRYRNVTR